MPSSPADNGSQPEGGRETAICVRFLDHALAEIALRQHAVVTLDQLRSLGLSERAVQWRAQRGRLHRVRRGVYALVPPDLLDGRGRWMAAVLACGPGAVLSHASAAALHG